MGRFPGPISWKTEVWIAEIQNAASISTANDSSAPMPGPHAPEPSARGHEPIGALRPWPPPLGGVAYARVRSPLPPILKRDACISILEDANLIFMTDPVRLARILKVLSVPARVRIVQLLKGRALCVNALTARLDMTQGAVSQHLRIMRDAGFVVDEKRGCFVHYRLNKEAFAEWQEQLGNLLDPDNASGENAMGAETCAVAMKKTEEQAGRSNPVLSARARSRFMSRRPRRGIHPVCRRHAAGGVIRKRAEPRALKLRGEHEFANPAVHRH
jgi:DNA-binding transcriptional ArsR family regulator